MRAIPPTCERIKRCCSTSAWPGSHHAAAAAAAGEGFAAWADMGALTSLSLQNGVSLTDAGLACLARLPALRSLNLKGCRALSDAGLAALQPLSRLEHLRLQVGLHVWPGTEWC